MANKKTPKEDDKKKAKSKTTDPTAMSPKVKKKIDFLKKNTSGL